MVADASLWDGKTAPDPVGQMLERAKRDREETDAENALTDEEWLAKKAREQAAAATPTLFAMERRVRTSAGAIREHADGADADGMLRTHGLEGLSEEQAQERAFEQAGENLPMLEKLVKAAAEKLGARARMRRVNKENGLATKKPSTARNKANRDYRGKIERVVNLIGGTVELPMNGDYAAAVETVQSLLPEGAEVARVKKLGFTTDAPSYKDVKVSVRFPNGGIGEIIIVDAFVNDAKFNRGGHVIYEIVRELEQYEDIEDVETALDRLRELSGIVYDSFADSASLERAKSSASSALERLQPSLKNIALSSSVMGMVKSPDLMSKVITPASVVSIATPSFSLIQNISGSDIAQNGEEFNTKNEGNGISESGIVPMGDIPKVSFNISGANEQDAYASERSEIERTARENGTWLKAPNGEDNKPTPEQWTAVRTRAFKQWFGDWESVSLFRNAYRRIMVMAPAAALTGNEFSKA